MTNSKISKRRRGSERIWLPSLLLLAQFLTITPVLLIILADEQQRGVSDTDATLLDALNRLSFSIADLENTPRSARGQTSPAWQQQYSAYQGELNRIVSNSATPPEIRASLARVDSTVQRMAENESGEQAPRAAGFQDDDRGVHWELLNAERLVRSELSKTGNGITRRATYLKGLVSGACLLLFGIVLVIRKFRIDAAIQKKLEGELRTTNEEVIAALAAARSESEAKTQILAHVGQWIKTPLNAAGAGANLAESLTGIADQVVDYSRIESGNFELRSVEFEPARIVAEVLELSKIPTEHKDVKLTSDVSQDLSITVKGDPDRLRQVLVNLISNAIRLTKKGEIVLRAGQSNTAEGRASFRFEVRHPGSGMTEEFRNRIFQPFSQVPGLQAGNEGTGLGLAISKKLVELMGGKMDLSSQPGRGCTFSFTAVFESLGVGSEPRRPSSEPASPAVSAAANTGPNLSSKARPAAKGGRERRTEPRQGVNYPTLLRSEQAGIAVIRILDVSTSGLRVSVPFRLELHTEVEIRIEGMSVVGLVRNCTCIRANEFHVGIAVLPASSEDEQFLHHLRLLHPERSVP